MWFWAALQHPIREGVTTVALGGTGPGSLWCDHLGTPVSGLTAEWNGVDAFCSPLAHVPPSATHSKPSEGWLLPGQRLVHWWRLPHSWLSPLSSKLPSRTWCRETGRQSSRPAGPHHPTPSSTCPSSSSTPAGRLSSTAASPTTSVSWRACGERAQGLSLARHGDSMPVPCGGRCWTRCLLWGMRFPVTRLSRRDAACHTLGPWCLSSGWP